MAKRPQSKNPKIKAKGHQDNAASKKRVSNMGHPPRNQPPNNPKRKRNNGDYAPTPAKIMRRFALCLRGFHWHRERPKVTDLLSVALTIAVALAAFWSAWIFRGQLEETRRSTRLSVRPWVGLEDTLDAIHNETPLEIDGQGNASIVYKIVAKNFSITPATNVNAFANLVLTDDTKIMYEQQAYACGDAVIGKPEIGQVLFPGKLTEFARFPISTKIISQHKNGEIGIWLAGCIGYRDQFNYLCRTKFVWYFKPDDGRVLVPPVAAQNITGHFVAGETGNAIDTCLVAKYNYGEGIYKDKPRNPN